MLILSTAATLFRRACTARIVLACCLLSCCQTAFPQSTFSPEESVKSVDSKPEAAEDSLRFAFERTPWRDVIKWLADECHLALHFEELPTGSFSYADPAGFDQQAAIARVNLFLLPQGFTLVQSEKLLSVINLSDPRSVQQLDALAQLVTAEQLDKLQGQQVVKCIFALGELTTDEAVQELEAINLMTTPAVFERTNRLMLTDTVDKLKNVKMILDAFQPSTMENGTVMKTLALQHVTAEDVLVVARPHLGLATGEMIGIDVSLSADLQGKHIFVTGLEDKVKLIEGLVASLDRPSDSRKATDGESELKSHLVEGGNVETVFSVVKTLLAGETIRLSMDESSNSIVALAPPAIQREIEQTVAQLQASEAEFEVIQLKTVDPFFVISLLEEMLDLPDAFDDDDDIDPDAPRIDADPGNMRLFVRAKRHRIDQIKKIVEGLDAVGSDPQKSTMRMLPIRGGQAERLLQTAAKFWRRENPILYFPASGGSDSKETERIINGRRGKTRLTAASYTTVENAPATVLSNNEASRGEAIRCQLTERGLLLQSDDASALDQFEEHLRAIAGPLESAASPPVVFYLRYTKPDDALRMLAELLEGGETAEEAEMGSLVNGYVSSANSFLGTIVTSRDGTTTLMADTITVVADSRLNRLIAQGTLEDIELIEDYLSIIDKDESLTEVRTYGRSHVIELKYTKASEVAASLREAYAGRLATASGGGNGNAAQAAQGARPAEGKKEEAKPDKKAAAKAGGAPAKNLEPKMTIAVHEPSNSLIVTAPDALFEEVEELVKVIDSRSQQSVAVISPENAAMLETILQGGSTQRNSSRNSNSRGSASSSGRSDWSILREKLGR